MSFTASSGGPPATGGLVGWTVVTGTGIYGVIVSKTGTVLTIDYWHTATNPAVGLGFSGHVSRLVKVMAATPNARAV